MVTSKLHDSYAERDRRMGIVGCTLHPMPFRDLLINIGDKIVEPFERMLRWWRATLK